MRPILDKRVIGVIYFISLIATCMVLAGYSYAAEQGAAAPEAGAPLQTEAESPAADAPETATASNLPEEAGVPAPAEAVPEEAPVPKTDTGNISIDFKDADILTVMRVLSEKSGVNIVAGKDVAGQITIRLANVNWLDALGMICKNYGYAYERDGNIIRVTTIENLQQEELTTEVFSLNYADSSEVAEAIKEMVSERGKDKIKFDSRTNVLIVTDVPTNLYRIRQVVDRLDMKTPQVLIEAKIIETVLTDQEKLGIDWTVKLTAAGAKRPTTFPFTFGGEMPYLGIPTAEWNRFMPRPEGDTTVTIDDTTGFVTTTVESEFPIEMANLTQAWDSPFPVMSADDFTFGVLDFSQFQIVLEFLRSRRDTNILSNPRITTLNNKNAEILVGEIIGIPTFERNSETGTIEITGYKDKELGVLLKVTPHINAKGDIAVELLPEISSLLGYDVLDSARGLRAPRFSTRKANTQVMVRNTQTIMIGGLIKDNLVDVEKKVPFLGDIPVLDKIFSKTEKQDEKTELIIFMTVHILTGEGDVSASTASNKAVIPLAEAKK